MVCRECGREMDPRGFQLLVPDVGSFDRIECAERAARRAKIGAYDDIAQAAAVAAAAAAPVVERSFFGLRDAVVRRPRFAAALGLVALLPAVGLAGTYVLRSALDRPDSALAGVPSSCACDAVQVGPSTRGVVVLSAASVRERQASSPPAHSPIRVGLRRTGAQRSGSPGSGSGILSAAPVPGRGGGGSPSGGGGGPTGGGGGGVPSGGGGSGGNTGGGSGGGGTGGGGSGSPQGPSTAPNASPTVDSKPSKPGWGYGDANHTHTGPQEHAGAQGHDHAKRSHGSKGRHHGRSK